ncbi:MAG: TolC family protein [Bacteroidales bacterium]|nr:TolC family protein [Bacteroidales bacterium]
MLRNFHIYVLFPLMLSGQSYSLKQCVEMALENNISLQRKANVLDSAKAFKRSVLTYFFPSIDASGTYLRMNKQMSLFEQDVLLPLVPYMVIDQQTGQVDPEKFKDPLIAATYLVIDPNTMQPVLDKDGNPIFRNYAWLPADKAKVGEKNNYLFQFTLKQPIFTGGKIWYGYQISKSYEKLIQEQVLQTREEVGYEVMEKYMQLVMLFHKRKLTQQYKSLVDALFHDVQNYREEGIVTDAEVQEVKVHYNEAVLNEMKATHGFDLMRMALCQKMGLPLYSPWIPSDTTLILPEVLLDTSKLMDEALHNRHEMKILEEKVNISSYQQKMSYGEMLPQIAFIANYLIMRPSPFQGMKDVFDHDYQIGVSITIPLFHAGERWQKIKMSRLAYQNDLLLKKEVEDLIRIDVQNKYFSYIEALQNVRFKEEGLKHKEVQLKQKKDRFDEGMVKVSDVIQAQTEWFHAKVDHLEAVSQAWTAYYQLLKAMGKLNY